MLWKDEYDFSRAERRRFHRPDAVVSPLVHLDADVLAFLSARAEACGITLSGLVSALLKKDIELSRLPDGPDEACELHLPAIHYVKHAGRERVRHTRRDPLDGSNDTSETCGSQLTRARPSG